MSWKDFVSLGIIVVGIILFLYGSNYYNAVIGWAGAFFIFGGFLTEIILKLYKGISKRES